MGKSFLSQEEIDALLGAGSQDSNIAENNAETLSAEEQDVLSEIGNINVGSASTALSELLNQTVIINAPTLNYTTLNELHQGFASPYLFVQVEYTSGIEGNNIFILKAEDASLIANIMMGGNGEDISPEMDEITLSAVSEAMNQMIGYSATSLSEMFNKIIEISPPQLNMIESQNDVMQLGMNAFEQLVVISFKLQIGDLLESQIMLVLKLDVAKLHVRYILEDTAKELGSITPKTEDTHKEATLSSIPQEKNLIEKNNTLLLNSGNLNLILDVPLRLSVLLGRTKRSIADILKLTHGSIVELERLEHEPVDILVNEKLIARGEVVVVKEYFGVRITEIISMENRLKNLVQK